MKQKLNDLVMLVKHDRKWQFAVGGLVFIILWGLLVDSKPRRRYAIKKPEIGTGATERDKSNQELMEFYLGQNRQLQRKIADQEEESKIMRDKIKDYESRTAEIFARLIERTRTVEDQLSALSKYQNKQIAPEAYENNTLVSIGPEDDKELVEPPKQPSDRQAVISAGDAVRVTLLAGVNAPTDGTPYPVMFKLVSDVTGPDGSSLPLGEGRLIAAAQGSLVDSRAIFRLNELSVRYPDGSRKVVGVDGWIVGEDGIRGMEGITIDPFGKVMAAQGLAGVVSGFGGNFGASSSAQITNQGITVQSASNSLENGLGNGVSNAGNAWQSYILERANLLVPQVKILSGRTATAVFSKNVVLDGLLESMEEPQLTYASLD